MSKCNCILVISYPLSPPFPFDRNYTCRRVKWGEHGMGPMQHWLTTATPFKSQKILKARALGSSFKKYISASNIKPALPSYVIYFISLLSSHPLWASPPPPNFARFCYTRISSLTIIGLPPEIDMGELLFAYAMRKQDPLLSVMFKRRPSRLQTADWADRADCAD